jgi:DNA-binding transcriptional LysR family regulator
MKKRFVDGVDLRHLRYFVAVAEELHFGRAAVRLGISQPPLSEQIRSLEETFGTELLLRTRRRVALTASGRLLYAEAVKLLSHADRVREIMVGARSGRAGHLFLGCVPSALIGALPTILNARDGSLDGLDIRVTEAHTGTIVAGVLDGSLDAGLAWEDTPPATLAIQPLEHVRFIVALHPTHRLAARKRISLSDVAQEPLVMSPRDVTPRQFDRIMLGFRQAGLQPRIAHHAGSISAQLGFVASGLGYAIVPDYARRLGMEGIEFRPLREILESSPLSLIWSTKRESPQLAVFRRRVEEAYRIRARMGTSAGARSRR